MNYLIKDMPFPGHFFSTELVTTPREIYRAFHNVLRDYKHL